MKVLLYYAQDGYCPTKAAVHVAQTHGTKLAGNIRRTTDTICRSYVVATSDGREIVISFLNPDRV